jgi:putative thiamine transport system permease protein
MFSTFTVTARWLMLSLLCIPVLAGIIGVVFPAFGYFPAIGEVQFSIKPFLSFFALEDVMTMIGLSLFTGLGSTLLATLGAFCLLAFFYQTRAIQKIQALLSPLLVIPHAAAAIALVFVISPSGFFARLFTLDDSALVSTTSNSLPFDAYGLSVLAALALKELPFIVLMALSAMSEPSIHSKLTQYTRVGTSLGYSRIACFFLLILPTLFPKIRLPLLAVLVFATSNVEIPLILGANNPSTLAVAVLHWFNHIDLSMRLLGSAGALVQVGVSCLALCLFFAIERGLSVLGRVLMVSGRRRFADRAVKGAAYAIIAVYIVLVGAIVYSVVTYSFAAYWVFPAMIPDGLTTIHWQTLFSTITQPFINTLVLGLLTSVSSIVVVLMALEAEVLQPGKKSTMTILSLALFLPLLVPGVAFLYGLVWFQQLFLQSATWFHTYIAHMVYVLPYVFLSLAVVYRKFDPRYTMVAQSLGKTPMQVFFVIKLPLMIGPIFVAWALGFAISLSQYLPTLLASGGAIPTVTTEAVASVSGSSTRLTAAYVIVQMVMPLIGFVVAWSLPRVVYNPRKTHRLSSKGEGSSTDINHEAVKHKKGNHVAE